MINRVVRHVGKVLDVKLENREGTTCRVEIKLQDPLKPGPLIRLEGKNIWLDFHYEKLSHYCYSCEKLGHYAMHCKDFPFDEEKMDRKDNIYYGQWLRAEVREHCPFWVAFYETNSNHEEPEDIIPETPQPSNQVIPMEQPRKEQNKVLVEPPADQSLLPLAEPLQWRH